VGGLLDGLDDKGYPKGGPAGSRRDCTWVYLQVPHFRAFDARIGKVLRVADLTENGRAVPITYEGRSGRQYSSVMAGGGPPIARNVDESRIGGRWHVFARPTPDSPPAVDYAWQGTMCG